MIPQSSTLAINSLFSFDKVASLGEEKLWIQTLKNDLILVEGLVKFLK